MTFADNIAKASSERYALVRLSPARIINDDVVEGATDYFTMAFTGNPFSVTLDLDTVFTEDTGLTVNNTWYYNSDTQVLYIRTSEAIEVPTSSLCVLHYITITDQRDIELSVDPIVGGDKAIWEDRLKQAPKISSSIANMVDGTMTTSASSINLENSDDGITEWFTSKDTYNSRDVDVWFSVDGVLAKVFSGTIRTLDFTTTTISLGVVDKSTLFDDSAYMGSAKEDSEYNTATHTIDEKYEGVPIPFVVRQSPSGEKQPDVETFELRDSTSEILDLSILDTSQMLEGHCIDHTTVVNTSNNRDWMLCRSTQHNADTLDWGGGSTTIVQKGSTNYDLKYQGNRWNLLNVTVSTAHGLEIGDTGEPTDSALAGSFTYHAVVVKIISDTNYWLAAYHPTMTSYTTDHTETTMVLPTNNRAVSIMLEYEDGEKMVPVENQDYTVNYTNLDNGTRQVDITFDSNFERLNSAHSLDLEALSSRNCRLFYKFRNSTETLHGTLVEQTLKGLDLTVNATSISDANSALTDGFTNGDCIMVVPSKGSTEHTTIRKVLAEILQTSIGYVRMDEDSEVYYELFNTPTGTSTRTDDDILSSTLIPRISYYDMFAKINVDNPYVKAESTLHPTTFNQTVATNLHKATREKKLTTVFDRIPGDMTARYNTFFGQPRVTYKYRTASLDLNTQLGDYITLEASNLLGGVSSVDILVTKFTKSTQGVDITGLAI